MKLSRKDYELAVKHNKTKDFFAYLFQTTTALGASESTFPPRSVLRKKGPFSTAWIEDHFGSYSNFRSWYFNQTITDAYKNHKKIELKDLVFEPEESDPDLDTWWRNNFTMHKKRRYIVTAACAGGLINQQFLDSLSVYRKHRNAELVILPMRGVSKDDVLIDKTIQETADFIGGEIVFNRNLKAMDFRLHPAQIIGSTGLKRFGQKDFSLIIAHTKQEMYAVPVSTGTSPHLVYTTGCITKQIYNYNRIGRIAQQDETYGGLIIEVSDEKLFHIREFQFDENGGFVDLKTYYSPEGVRDIDAILVGGDVHVTDTDPTAEQATKEQLALLKPSKMMLHDLFSGNTINHHISNQISKVVRAREKYGTLEQELNEVVNWLQSIASSFPETEFNVVASNHNEWLNHWLEKGLYTKEPENHRLGLKLAMYVLDDLNPLEEYFKLKLSEQGIELNNVKFLSRDDSLKLYGYELALHGDKSHSGRFGSVQALEESYGKCIAGHHHSPRVFRGVRIVGTMSILNPEYTKGYGNSWLHTNCVLYANGTAQMLTSIDGKWKASF